MDKSVSYPSETPSMEESPGQKVLEAKTLARVIDALQELNQAARKRILQTASIFYGTEVLTARESESTYPSAHHQRSVNTPIAPFTEDRTPSPKEFLLAKAPSTDTDKVACLAYYLTHFKDTPHFKTIDISKLNTEAAQTKFSNATRAVDDATKAGILVPAGRGNKQISAPGEVYVQTLPDKQAAKSALSTFRSKRKVRKASHTPDGKN